MAGCGCEQQSDTAILCGIEAQFHFGVISLSPDADAVVALKTNVVFGFLLLMQFPHQCSGSCRGGTTSVCSL